MTGVGLWHLNKKYMYFIIQLTKILLIRIWLWSRVLTHSFQKPLEFLLVLTVLMVSFVMVMR